MTGVNVPSLLDIEKLERKLRDLERRLERLEEETRAREEGEARPKA